MGRLCCCGGPPLYGWSSMGTAASWALWTGACGRLSAVCGAPPNPGTGLDGVGAVIFSVRLVRATSCSPRCRRDATTFYPILPRVYLSRISWQAPHRPLVVVRFPLHGSSSMAAALLCHKGKSLICDYAVTHWWQTSEFFYDRPKSVCTTETVANLVREKATARA